MTRRTLLGLALCALCLLAAPALRAQDAADSAPEAEPMEAEPMEAEPMEAEPMEAEPMEYVDLASGERIAGHVELHTPLFKSNYLTVDDTTRIEIARVRAYRSSEGYFRRVTGSTPTFARRVRTGRIDLYERSETVMIPTMTAPGAPGGAPIVTGGGIGSASFGYFAKGDGEVQRLKPGALRAAMADDPASLRYLNQHRTLGIVQTGLALTGLGIVVASIAGHEKGEPLPSAVFVGMGVGLTSWIPHLMRSDKVDAAVREYNRHRLTN